VQLRWRPIFNSTVGGLECIAMIVAYETLRKDEAMIPRSVILNRTAGLCMLYAFCSSAALNVIDYFVSSPLA